jgi:hypothetical protein
MAYTGFIAMADRYEVAVRKKGERQTTDGIARSADPSRGSWTIPIEDAANFPDDAFVTTKDPVSGEVTKVKHERGSFVFRLAGRDRARSASFYTPSVLTEFTVRHALDEWLSNHPDVTAADILDLTILEPALGSGAFAHEAIDQLANLYLRLREDETDDQVAPEDRLVELRKVRAHFAINKTYGVDLNATAVELAEVSLWLNAMHPGLAAPSLSHRLRRGNSLIGCSRSTYTVDQLRKQPWKKVRGEGPTPPTDHPLHECPLGSEGLGVHHFLVPGEGWGAAAKTGKGNPVRELAEDWAETVWEWRKQVHAKPSNTQLLRAQRLAPEIERLWKDAAADVAAHLQAQNKQIEVWRQPNGYAVAAGGSSAGFNNTDGPYHRLKTIMDAWCALWMWAPANGTGLPSLDQWFDMVEYVTGNKRSDSDGRLFGEHTTIEVAGQNSGDSLFETRVTYDVSTSLAEARSRWPWLQGCAEIAESQGFFHWELDFAAVLEAGGFDLQVGNPPWVRPTWDEPACLAEVDPWWGITNLKSVPDATRSARRVQTLAASTAVARMLQESAENIGVNELLGSYSREPLLDGSRPTSTTTSSSVRFGVRLKLG